MLKWIVLIITASALSLTFAVNGRVGAALRKPSVSIFSCSVSNNINRDGGTDIASIHNRVAAQGQTVVEKNSIEPIAGIRDYCWPPASYSYLYLFTSHLLLKNCLQQLYPSHYFW